jgi:dihydrofolate synthase/folylpolyglutamate synthase
LRNLGAEVRACASVAEALLVQCGRASEDDEILVFGSFYCVAEALEWLGQQAEAGDGGAG